MSLPDTLPGLNLRDAVQRLGGRETLLLKQLKRFAEEQSNAVQNLHNEISQGMQDEATRLAHSLKGLAATLGCDQLSEQARAVESQLKEGLSPQLEVLQSTLNEALESIRSLPGPEVAAVARPVSNALGLDDKLNSLMDGLKRRDFSVVAAYEQIESELKSRFPAGSVEQISGSIRNYDLSAAAAALETLLHEARGRQS